MLFAVIIASALRQCAASDEPREGFTEKLKRAERKACDESSLHQYAEEMSLMYRAITQTSYEKYFPGQKGLAAWMEGRSNTTVYTQELEITRNTMSLAVTGREKKVYTGNAEQIIFGTDIIHYLCHGKKYVCLTKDFETQNFLVMHNIKDKYDIMCIGVHSKKCKRDSLRFEYGVHAVKHILTEYSYRNITKLLEDMQNGIPKYEIGAKKILRAEIAYKGKWHEAQIKDAQSVLTNNVMNKKVVVRIDAGGDIGERYWVVDKLGNDKFDFYLSYV